MKSRPPTGTLGEIHFVVSAEHVIDFATEGMPAVLSTPRLIGLIERTARESLGPFLDTDERTVFVDTRAPEAWDTSDMKLPGAIRVSPHEVEQHLAEIPRNASIITYCT